MIENVLDALLWHARVALRSRGDRVRAGHGYADSTYRPPSLPFVSVLGPFDIAVEPERDTRSAGVAEIRFPGHLIGAPRADTDVAPNNGALRLRFDERAVVDLTNLAGGSFANAALGPQLAQQIDTQLTAAVTNATFVDLAGGPLTPAETASLAGLHCRWDVDLRRFVLHSGPSGVTAFEDARSRVDVDESVGTPATYGLVGAGAVARPGLVRRHNIPAPVAIAIDMRWDLWTATQRELARLVDEVAQVAPTRGRLLVLPGLLARDVADGATELHLLARGEPTLDASLVHHESTDEDRERVGPRLVTIANGTLQPTPARIALAANGTATWRVHPPPLVPNPLHITQPLASGYALAVEVALGAALADGDTVELARLEWQGNAMLTATITGIVVNSVPHVRFAAQAAFGPPAATASTAWEVPADVFAARTSFHIRVDPIRGAVDLYVDGEPQATDAQTALTPGTPTGGDDMTLRVGGPADDVALDVFAIHLIAQPFGPVDPRLRASPTRAAMFEPGDTITVADSIDGVRARERRVTAIVASVAGDVVTLTGPIVGGFRRGRSIIFRDEVFFQQKQFRRRDDLLNHLFRCSVDYRVSGLLENRRQFSTAPLVTDPEVTVVARIADPENPERLSERRYPETSPGVLARDGS